MDAAQIVLLTVVVVLTILLILLGIQVFFILKELRKSVEKANKILDDAATISQSISTPISNFSNIISGIKTGVTIAKLFGLKKKKSKEENDGERE